MFDIPRTDGGKRNFKWIGIVGSRRVNSGMDQIRLQVALDKIYKPGDRIVSGGCPQGADNFAEIIAKTRQIPILIFYAEWNRSGKGAGVIRNTDIVTTADVIIALPAQDRTGGTEDSIRKALDLEKQVIIVLDPKWN